MKKVFAFFVAMMLLVSVGCVSAEEATEESSGILFQGIPWGSSVEDVAEWVLQRDDFCWKTIVTTVERFLNNWLPLSTRFYTNELLRTDGTTFDHSETNKYRNVLATWRIDGSIIPDFQIAGYKVSSIDYDFSYDGETTGLIEVGVTLHYPNGSEAAFEDLQQKLRTVYGEGDIDDEKTYFKMGENNTAVLLRKKENPILIYGITNATELLDALMGEIPAAATPDPSDSSGL